jgi:hypothetical protein
MRLTVLGRMYRFKAELAAYDWGGYYNTWLRLSFFGGAIWGPFRFPQGPEIILSMGAKAGLRLRLISLYSFGRDVALARAISSLFIMIVKMYLEKSESP